MMHPRIDPMLSLFFIVLVATSPRIRGLGSGTQMRITAILSLGMGLVFEAWGDLDVDIYGSLSQGYLHSTGNKEWSAMDLQTSNGTFEFTEVLVGVSSEISPKLRAGAQLISRDFGTKGNFDTSLDWGYGDYLFRRELGVRIGKMKLARGLYNETRDVNFARTNVLLDQGMYPEDWRGFVVGYQGLEIYGSLDHLEKWLGLVDYQLMVGSLEIPEDFFFVKNIQEGIDSDFDTLQTDLFRGLHVKIFPDRLEGLTLATSFARWEGHADLHLFKGVSPFTQTFVSIGGEIKDAVKIEYSTFEVGFEYQLRDWTLFGEFQNTWADVEFSDALERAEAANALQLESIILRQGLSSSATPDDKSYYLGFGRDLTEAISARISHSIEHGNKEKDDVTLRTTFSMRYDPSDDIFIKAEWHDVFEDRNQDPGDASPPPDSHWGFFVSQVGISF